MKQPDRHPKARRGFSLIELLITLAISAVIAGGIVSLMVSQMQLSTTQNRNMINQQTVRDVVKFMVEEIQLAGTLDGTEPVIIADYQAFSFYADIDANGVTDRIDYYLDESNTLMRRYSTDNSGTPFIAEDPIMSNVYYINFSYFNIDDTMPANNSEINSVELKLELDISQGTGALTSSKLAQQAMVGRATLRNKMLDN
ncbi:prepilin-type N-terminal cleavage/methylation domain-containing protein [bacterium]|nr:prepilin-type N-terminal cleavage/methylation domain-containing protein [bacterium]